MEALARRPARFVGTDYRTEGSVAMTVTDDPNPVQGEQAMTDANYQAALDAAIAAQKVAIAARAAYQAARDAHQAAEAAVEVAIKAFRLALVMK